MDARLIGTFRLKSPLSHIGESIGTTSYLVQEPILQEDGTVEEVFSYSGNAWRGQLRDLAAAYLLEHLGNVQIGVDTFHLLFGGGKIGGEQVVNLEAARVFRKVIPLIAVWGGGVGNQIMPGKMRVGNSYPVCREAAPVLRWHGNDRISYRQLTTEKSFSRKDDAKDERLTKFIALPEPMVQQVGLLDDPAPKKGAKKGKADGEVADQMRMTSELLIAGTQLETWIDLIDVTEVELGCLVSALDQFARSPHIGGQANKGHGLVELTYRIQWRDQKTDDGKYASPDDDRFFTSTEDGLAMGPEATLAKEAYDRHLQSMYDAMLADNRAEIVKLLGVAA